MDKKDLEKKIGDLTDDKLERLETKVDKILVEISSLNVTSIRQQADLEHHIYRTTLAEENITIIREEFKPVKKHVDQISGVFKLIGILASLAGIGKLLLELSKF